MANTVTPTFTDNVSVVAAAVLAKGSTARGTVDLRLKFGAYLFLKIGRGGTTAITAAVRVQIRRMLNNGAASTVGGVHPGGIALLSSTEACNYNSTVNVNAGAGDVELKTVNITNAAVDDIICIQDAGGGVTRLEWARISKLTVGSGTGVTLDSPLLFAHTSVQADTVRNKADAFAPIWLGGGSLWEVIFDYGSEASAESVTIQAMAQTYDSDSIA